MSTIISILNTRAWGYAYLSLGRIIAIPTSSITTGDGSITIRLCTAKKGSLFLKRVYWALFRQSCDGQIGERGRKAECEEDLHSGKWIQ